MTHPEDDGYTRREFINRVAAGGVAAYVGMHFGAGLSAAEPPPETTTLRIRQWRPACWAPIHVAEPLLREEGFKDIQYLSGPGPDYTKMLKQGLVDISPQFVAQSVYDFEKNNPPQKVLSGLHVGCYALVGSERVNSVRDLKGKTVWVGSVEYNGPHLFFMAIVNYVGLDAHKDIKYAWVKKDEAMNMFHEGKIDAFMSFPPGPQELMDKGIGRLLVDTNVDRPWSQYFCCMVNARSDFVKNNPIAARRALRAILKANDIVANDPQLALRVLQEKKIWKKSETKYILKAITEIPYGKWRLYKPEETIRFYALRLREAGMISTPPDEFLNKYAEWGPLNELKSDFGISW
jgi:NitT/TauT family transport system substrate-binding protein